VLPIEKELEQYRIQFSTEFEVNPEELVTKVSQVVKDCNLAAGYSLQVEHCETGEIVYSYEIGALEDADIIPCKSRDLARSCYNLLITLNTGPELFAAPTSIPERESGIESDSTSYIPIALAAIALALLLFYLSKRNAPTGLDADIISLGKYRFDKNKAELLLDGQQTELTGKEANLLLALHKRANTTVEREVILHEVWGDEGDYIGRTLDVFISKLRKKLESDASVRIVNIRGVGYKLVMDVST